MKLAFIAAFALTLSACGQNPSPPLPGESNYAGTIPGYKVEIRDYNAGDRGPDYSPPTSTVILSRIGSSEKLNASLAYIDGKWLLSQILFFNRACDWDGVANFDFDTGDIKSIETPRCVAPHLNQEYVRQAYRDTRTAMGEIHNAEHLVK